MAFEADCGSSTVLEAPRVASTPGHPWVWLLAALATRPSATAPRRLRLSSAGIQPGGRQIRIPKSEISAGERHS
jgi:hypothetical protein